MLFLLYVWMTSVTWMKLGIFSLIIYVNTEVFSLDNLNKKIFNQFELSGLDYDNVGPDFNHCNSFKQSVPKHFHELEHYFDNLTNRFDIIALCETKLTDDIVQLYRL